MEVVLPDSEVAHAEMKNPLARGILGPRALTDLDLPAFEKVHEAFRAGKEITWYEVYAADGQRVTVYRWDP